jgi:hypothetical protein
MPVASAIKKFKFTLEEFQNGLAACFHIGLTQRIAGAPQWRLGSSSPMRVIAITAWGDNVA